MMGTTVLLAMSSPQQDALREMLSSAGINPICAGDCERARELLGRHSEVRVVICDLSLPDGNWWSLHKTLLELERHAELIICLPSGHNRDVRELLGHGVFGVITPPLREEEVLSLVMSAAGIQPRSKAQAHDGAMVG